MGSKIFGQPSDLGSHHCTRGSFGVLAESLKVAACFDWDDRQEFIPAFCINALQQIDSIIRWQFSHQFRNFIDLTVFQNFVFFIRIQIRKNINSGFKIRLLDHSPCFFAVEPGHEFGGSHRIQCFTKIAQTVRIIFGQHLAKFWKVERIDHCLAAISLSSSFFSFGKISSYGKAPSGSGPFFRLTTLGPHHNPRSASSVSPGPLTRQPITAIVIA